MDRTTDSMIGRTIAGKYTILTVLGGGGMGTVYRARQAGVNREVAIKIMNPELADSEQYLTRFAREAERMGALEHPHIIPVIDYGTTDGVTYIVMALKTGGNLGDVIKRGHAPLSDISHYVTQIASALDYAHQRGIIHRDLKPANILLDEERNTFLTDFGIARKLGETKLTAQGMVVGSPTYMAPEAWRGEEASPETDIYSLGVILFELLTGKPPYNDKMPARIMLMHIQDPIPSVLKVRSDLAPQIEAVVMQALAKERRDRYSSATAMALALKSAVSKAPTVKARTLPPDDENTAILTPEKRATPPPVPSPAPTPARTPTPTPSRIPTQTPQRTENKPAAARKGANNTRLILIGMVAIIVLLLGIMLVLLLTR